MTQKTITQKEKSKKELKAEEQFKRAKANLAKVKREMKNELRKEQNHHKYVIGGIVKKYFPECFEFSEVELNRIIACAFSLEDVQNMIQTVISEREQSGDDAENEDGEGEEVEG